MTATTLYNSILVQAIEGHLVPQLDGEEDASVLLNRVRKRKEQLVKEKKGKADKPFDPIEESEYPIDLPRGWAFCRLGELGFYKKGPFGSALTKSMFVPKSSKSVKVYEQKNAIQKDYSLGDYYITSEYFEKMRGFEVHPGDIIVSCAGTIGETYVIPQNAPVGIINQALMRVTLADDSITDYWRLFFEYVLISSSTLKGNGSAIKNIPPFEILKNIVIPLPPIEEQRRIVNKIKSLLPQIDKFGNSQEELNNLNKILPDKLRKSVLQEAIHGSLVPNDIPEGEATGAELLQQILKERQEKENKEKGKKAKKLTLSTIEEEPWELPEGWCWCRGKDIFFPMESIKPSSDFVYIDTDAVNNKKNTIDNPKNILLKDAPSRATRKLHANDILFSMVRPYLKNIAYVDERFASAIGTTGFYVITTSSSIYQPYLFKLMLSDYVVSGLTEYMKGDNSPSINNGHIEDFLYPLPPLSIQHRIFEKIEELFSAINKLQA